jgi:hypothetical protein
MKKVLAIMLIFWSFLSCQEQSNPNDQNNTSENKIDSTHIEKEIIRVRGQEIKDLGNGMLLFKGDYFDIAYPENFTTWVFSQKDSTDYFMTDEAYFESPEGDVEFFVYSPQWSGEPWEYLKVPESEILLSTRSEVVREEEREGQYGDKIVKWMTVKSRDGSYLRSILSIREQVGTGSELHHVFGIKYKDERSLARYRDEYLAFKASLRQYSD